MEVDECESSPCFFESTCMDRLNGYVCMCGLGYKGTLCYESVTCDDDPCLNGGVCNYTMDMRSDQVAYFTHIIHAYDHVFCHVLYFNDSSWEAIYFEKKIKHELLDCAAFPSANTMLIQYNTDVQQHCYIAHDLYVRRWCVIVQLDTTVHTVSMR